LGAFGSLIVVRLTFPAHRAGQAELAHQPLHGAARDRRLPGWPFAVQGQPHLPSSVNTVVRRVNRGDPRLQLLVPHLLLSGLAGAVLVVGRGGDLGAKLRELVADRLDTPSQTIAVADTDVLVDVGHDQRCGRSSSAAKKTDADLRIALARFSSAFSRFNRFSSADSSLVSPGR
jgi:hypothetical protein